MDKFVVHQGLVAPMDRENVDTDAIIPKQFLKSIKRTGFGPNLFDAEGRRYLDFFAGIVTLSCGHSHPKVVARVRELPGDEGFNAQTDVYENLVEAGILQRLPAEPFGGKYVYDPMTGEIRSSEAKERMRIITRRRGE